MVAKLLKINMLLLRAHDFSSDFSIFPLGLASKKEILERKKSENL